MLERWSTLKLLYYCRQAGTAPRRSPKPARLKAVRSQGEARKEIPDAGRVGCMTRARKPAGGVMLITGLQRRAREPRADILQVPVPEKINVWKAARGGGIDARLDDRGLSVFVECEIDDARAPSLAHGIVRYKMKRLAFVGVAPLNTHCFDDFLSCGAFHAQQEFFRQRGRRYPVDLGLPDRLKACPNIPNFPSVVLRGAYPLLTRQSQQSRRSKGPWLLAWIYAASSFLLPFLLPFAKRPD
jgi:hypothetical protein